MTSEAMSWHSQSLTGLSLRSPGFHRGSVGVKFKMDRAAVGQVVLRVLLFSPVTVIPTMFHTRSLGTLVQR